MRARVTVVVLCVCVYVCPLISAASHIGITKERYQQVHSNTVINTVIIIIIIIIIVIIMFYNNDNNSRPH